MVRVLLGPVLGQRRPQAHPCRRLGHHGRADDEDGETVSVLAQALSFSELALNYDHGFIVDYNTDLTKLGWSTATQLRDAALAKFDTAITLATAGGFTSTADGFFGPGITYSNVAIAQIANTMAARTL